MKVNLFNVVKKNQLVIGWVISFAILVLIALVKFGFHEQWKDEWQAWFLSRDLNLVDLLKFLYYEGHPSLWYIFLKPFTWIFPNGDFGLKLAHFIPVIALFLLWFQTKIPLFAKILIAVSYPFIFEYGIVSRGYILTILLGLILLLFYRKKTNWTPIILFFLCQTEIQGVFFGFAFLLVLLYQEKWSKNWIRSATGMALGFIVFLISVYPRGQTDELQFAYSAKVATADSWWTAFQGTTSNAFFMGLIPDTNVFGTSLIGLIVGLFILVGIGYVYRREWSAAILFFSFWLATFLFHGVIYNGGLRQWAMVFVVWALSLLLVKRWQSLSKKIMVLALCIGPLYYSFLAVQKDLTMPFSNSRDVGLFIQKEVPENVPIVAINKFQCTPVVGYAQRPIYSLPTGTPFTYFKWVEKIYLPPQSELDLFAQFKNTGGLVIVTPFVLDATRYPDVELWKKFDQPNLKGENYLLYTYKRKSNQ